VFGRRKVSELVERYAADRGWHVISLYQPPWLFVPNGRRLTRCAEPCDPWLARLGNGECYLFSDQTCEGVGATPDAAVLAAIPHDLKAALRRCELAVDSLHDCLSEVTSRGNGKDRFDETL
jgi:hypothetical protein